jgi:pyruvate ferredoxin oxidoreductase gamma subunit
VNLGGKVRSYDGAFRDAGSADHGEDRTMFQIRIHGRGGQGVVTAAELLSVAAFEAGSFAQAFPTFGSERTGAPVVSYCRIDDRQIRVREPIGEPDGLIVQDPTLLHQVDVFSGVAPGAFVLINTSGTIASLGIEDFAERFPPGHILTVPASDIAREHLGRPLANAALLGGFAAMTGVVSLEGVTSAIRERFPAAIADGNVAAAEAAHAFVTELVGAVNA